MRKILDLGMQTVVAFPEKADAELPKAPLEVMMCTDCTLLQLRYSFNKELLYREYWYESHINPMMVKALKDVVDKATEIIRLEKGDIVIDIGSNDSTLLLNYPKDVVKVGFEPSNIAKIPEENGILVNDFFNAADYYKAMSKPAKMISSCACFYDLLDPNAFLQDVCKCLDRDGLFIIQINYLGLMIRNKTYDDIVIEHECFYSLRSLEFLLERNGLEVIDAELNSVNGGSIRVYIKHRESILSIEGGSERVRVLRLEEEAMGLGRLETYERFHDYMEMNKQKALSFIKGEVEKGKKISIEGCSTRGLVQLQYIGLTDRDIAYAIDKNPRKYNRYYANTKIKIFPPEDAYKVDYKLVLPYHFLEGIKRDNSDFTRDGGKLITLIPEFNVIGN